MRCVPRSSIRRLLVTLVESMPAYEAACFLESSTGESIRCFTIQAEESYLNGEALIARLSRSFRAAERLIRSAVADAVRPYRNLMPENRLAFFGYSA